MGVGGDGRCVARSPRTPTTLSPPNWPRPMAPARSSARRAQRTHNTRNKQQPAHDPPPPQQQQPVPVPQPPPPPPQSQPAVDPNADKLFLDPMSGQPLSLYVEKDVDNKDSLSESIVVSRLSGAPDA